MTTAEAVEAAAKVLVEDGAHGVPWGDASGDDRADAMGKARRYLEAAAPFMMADFRRQLASSRDEADEHIQEMNRKLHAMPSGNGKFAKDGSYSNRHLFGDTA